MLAFWTIELFDFQHLHVRRELTQRLVKIVHLRENASYDHNNEDICRRMRELVVTRERHLERQTERLDEHDRDRASCRADGEVDERVLATVLGRDLVDHEDGEDGDKEAVEEESCEGQLSVLLFQGKDWKGTYQAGSQGSKPHQPTQPPCPAVHATQ